MDNVSIDQIIKEIPATLRLPFTVPYKSNLVIIAIVQYFNITNDVSDSVRNLEEISAFIEILGKVWFLTYYMDDMLRLIQITKLFWNPNRCSQQIATKLSQIYNLIYRLQTTYALFMLVGAVFMILAPLLEKTLPMGIWTLEGHDKLHHFVMTEQLIIMPCSGILLWTLDCMYIGFCGEIVAQFKILCQYLKDLTTEVNTFDETKVNYLNGMKTCIRHHQLMLRFIKEFRQTFSSILLIQYLTVGPLMCAELFAAFEGSYEGSGRKETNSWYGKDQTKWSKIPSQRSRTLAHSIIFVLLGFQRPAGQNQLSSPLELWQLLLPHSVLEEIVDFTNQKVETARGKNKRFKRSRSFRTLLTPTFVKDIALLEIKAFLGCLYLQGIYKFGHEDT
ncbi:hypothetical protein ILUMI_03401 [Ignelater luminosus]|uniref:Odorant receptor n=1 Tax=Ignelater luminosus TaxID=2038154 RepID=A0A8K0DLW1_IGNLU|nr:hypothetical protein ILUMI_03401 [Ignelater luminosus]